MSGASVLPVAHGNHTLVMPAEAGTAEEHPWSPRPGAGPSLRAIAGAKSKMRSLADGQSVAPC